MVGPPVMIDAKLLKSLHGFSSSVSKRIRAMHNQIEYADK